MPDFDPYHRWLGIPPDEQPAGPHRLLGISPDENDPRVVQEAALRQTAFVRQFSLREHGEHAEREHRGKGGISHSNQLLNGRLFTGIDGLTSSEARRLSSGERFDLS